MIPLASQTGIALLKIVSGEKPRQIAWRILRLGAGGDFVEAGDGFAKGAFDATLAILEQSANRLAALIERLMNWAETGSDMRGKGAPVEPLVALGYYLLYPENHGAVCGIRRVAEKLCGKAEAAGFSRVTVLPAQIERCAEIYPGFYAGAITAVA